MIGVFLRQWRRIMLGAALVIAFLGAMILTGNQAAPDLSGPPVVAVLAIALTGLIVSGGLTLVLSVLRPGFLPLVERGFLVLSLAGLILPALAPLGLPGWSSCGVFALLFLAVSYALAGSWQSRFAGPGRPHTGQFRVALPLDEVRRRVIPDPATISRHYWPGSRVADAPDGSDADFVLTRPRHGRWPDCVMNVRVTEDVPGRLWTIEAAPVEGDASPPTRTRIGLAPTPRGTHVTVTEQILSALPGHRLDWWLMGDFHDHLASMKARLTGRRDLSIHGRQMVRRTGAGDDGSGTRGPAGALQPG